MQGVSILYGLKPRISSGLCYTKPYLVILKYLLHDTHKRHDANIHLLVDVGVADDKDTRRLARTSQAPSPPTPVPEALMHQNLHLYLF